MAIEFVGTDIALLAAEDLSDYQYCFVIQAGDTTVQLANGATEIPLGILQNAPGSGDVAIVRLDGISKLVMNAALTVGDMVKNEYQSTTDNGKGSPLIGDGYVARGLVVQASGAEDDVGAVLLTLDKESIISSVSPSISPSISPSVSPSISPSVSPSLSPSLSPSISPSKSPSISPSISPSLSPSLSPSVSPSS